jgi:hypothetical protein
MCIISSDLKSYRWGFGIGLGGVITTVGCVATTGGGRVATTGGGRGRVGTTGGGVGCVGTTGGCVGCVGGGGCDLKISFSNSCLFFELYVENLGIPKSLAISFSRVIPKDFSSFSVYLLIYIWKIKMNYFLDL